ncbi:hypothetical protein VCHC67A1_03397B, partial [Vibrio cholerae HC-67A1]
AVVMVVVFEFSGSALPAP